MSRLVLCGWFALIFSFGLSASQALASDSGLHMATFDFGGLLNWLRNNYGGGTYGGGSVPVPGTLLVFGLGFAGLAAWRAKRSEE